MANADAWSAPDGEDFCPPQDARGNGFLAMRALADPAYRRCLPPSLFCAARSRRSSSFSCSCSPRALPVADGAARRRGARRQGHARPRRRRTRQRADACRERPQDGDADARRPVSEDHAARHGSIGDAMCLPSPTARSRSSRHRRRAAWQGQNARQHRHRAASRCSCSATAPASWTSGSAVGAGMPALDLTDSRSGAADRAWCLTDSGLRRMAQDRFASTSRCSC